MTTQPEALRLTRKFEEIGFLGDHKFAQDHWCRQAAVELRRLHAENQQLHAKNTALKAEIESLQARVQELGEMVRENRSKKVIELEGHIAELEAQLSAIGAGGVEPLRKQAAPHEVHPESIREGAPYDNPEFEQLARDMGVWGTAQSAVCAQFWLAATPAADAPVVPQGWKLVQIELLERIQESLGSFLSDQGWSQSDMDTADALGGLLAAAPKPPACNQSMQPELATYSAQARNKKGIKQ